ncbi:putative RNA polymerase I specific transcription initiation factor RRN3 [Rosa chinensis]|uniref:Putative RNA polymerase I specific transcription initiation factor RRN3 n=1 Tax=Rosa chinensis TaxID=74649 RepID=A0A2P6RL90_ROSCH|nr:putative RNA polymerase I specific transcription initiation factor RRN3 [Rosa chinensis]
MNDAVYSEYDLALHVKEVLVSFSSGDVESSENYRNLVAVLHRKKNLSPRDLAELVAILKGLSGAAAYIDSAHCDLYSAIFNMILWNYGPGVMDAMIELIIALATSSGKYLDICLEMLVSNFVSQDPYMLDKLKVPHGLKKKDQVLTRVHRALKVISDLSPLSPRNLLILVYRGLNGYYTRKGTSTLALELCVENMPKLESGALG